MKVMLVGTTGTTEMDVEEDAVVDSVTLSKALDVLGINTEMIDYNISTYKKMQLTFDFSAQSPSTTTTRLIATGSMAERSHFKGLNSDADIMVGLKNIVVIEKENDEFHSPPGDCALLMQEGGVHTGFVMLQLVDLRSLLVNPNHFRLHNNLLWYFSSQNIQQTFPNILHTTAESNLHGPSLCEPHNEHTNDTDFVPYLPCRFWPHQSEEWLERKRQFQWPPKSLMQNAKAGGFLLVPIGFPGSPTEDIEWRISFSELERDLVWSWNHIQLKCYTFLKAILKILIDPLVPDVLCSYQLKTLMFWQVEETSHEIWTPERLVFCITALLQRLLQWVEVGQCPHYFIKENNLFERKVHGPEKEKIIGILQKLLQEGMTYRNMMKLFGIDFFNMIDESSQDVSELNVGYIQCVNREYHGDIFDIRACTLFDLLADDLPLTIEKHNDLERQHQSSLKRHPVGMRRLIQVLLRPLYTSLGSYYLSMAMASTDQPTKEAALARALYNLERGKQYDAMSGKLALAMFHYMIKNHCEALEIICQAMHQLSACFVEEYNGRSLIAPERPLHISISDLEMPLKDVLSRFYIVSATYRRFEISAVPKPLQYEIGRAQVAIPRRDILPNMRYVSTVDSVVLAYFIQFLCHHEMQLENDMKATLFDFTKYVSQRKETLHNYSSALNLQAQSYYMIGDVASAVTELGRSLHVEPSYTCNAAPWMLGVIVYEQLYYVS